MEKIAYIEPPIGSSEWETQRLRMIAWLKREVPNPTYALERAHCWEDLTYDQRCAILQG